MPFPAIAGALLPLSLAAALGCLIAPRTPIPGSVRFVLGAVAASLTTFVLLLARLATLPVFLALTLLCLVTAWRIQPDFGVRLPALPWTARAFFALIALAYAVTALAPEVQPDALAYHLRLAREYAALHAFTGRIAFFDVMPQGAQMLFVPAVEAGGFIAAKLVHFAFLLITLPLTRRLAHLLHLSDTVALTAMALFFLAPVAAVDGTCAYVDMALVAASLVALFFLLAWRRGRAPQLLFCAGFAAGFCYTVKQTFGWVVLCGVGFVFSNARRFRPAALFSAAAALAAGPWIARALALTGNPFAPFLNALWPNESSTVEVERALSTGFSVFRLDFHWAAALPAWTVTGGNTGLLGIGFVFSPLAILAVRRREGRLLLSAAALLAFPALANTGTRFLMPAAVLLALALAMVLPRWARAALVAVQLAGSLPAAMDLYDRHNEWRLHEWPVRAALGIEGERDYLTRHLPEYGMTELVERKMPPGARILSFAPVDEAYTSREILPYWHAARAQRFTGALDFARVSAKEPPAAYRADAAPFIGALRITSPWLVRFVEGSGPWPQTQRREIARLDFVVWPGDAPLRIEAKNAAGEWRSVRASKQPNPVDLRGAATAWIAREGYRYILISDAPGEAFSGIGADIAAAPGAWGVRPAARSGSTNLFEIQR